MSWPCYVVMPEGLSNVFRCEGELVTWYQLRPGACWLNEDGELCIKLPGLGSEFNADRGRHINARRAEQGKRDRLPEWSHFGELPRITVNPSVNCIGVYHGWIRDGVITDDCEGRKFDAMGKAI